LPTSKPLSIPHLFFIISVYLNSMASRGQQPNKLTVAAATEKEEAVELMPELRKSVFVKVDQLKPRTFGYNWTIKISESNTIFNQNIAKPQ
ncbi:hypothetical protein ACH5RR_018007, partial [Cinchona calisaya]